MSSSRSSTILAFHQGIEGKSAGGYPQVSSIITGSIRGILSQDKLSLGMFN